MFFRKNFYLLTSTLLMSVFMANDIFLPAIPDMAIYFAASQAKVQLGVAFFLLGSLSLQIFVGPISDRLGRRPVLIMGGLIYLLGSIACTMAQSLNFFLVARMFQGISMATTIIAALAAINEYYESNAAIKAIAISSNITMLAPMLGPLFGSLILEIFKNWRYPLAINALIGLCAWLLLIFYMPETLKKYDDEGKPRKSLSLLTIFKQLPKIIKNKAFILYSISLALTSFSFLIWVTGAPVMYMTKLSLSHTQYSLYQMPVFVLVIVGNSFAPYLARRFGRQTYMNLVHSVLLFIWIPMCAVLFFLRSEALALVIPMGLFALVVSTVGAMKNHLIVGIPEHKGSAASIMNIIIQSGTLLGSLTATALGDYPNKLSLLSVAIAAFCVGFLALIANRYLKISY